MKSPEQFDSILIILESYGEIVYSDISNCYKMTGRKGPVLAIHPNFESQINIDSQGNVKESITKTVVPANGLYVGLYDLVKHSVSTVEKQHGGESNEA